MNLKTLWKNSTSVLSKTSKKIGMDGYIFNIVAYKYLSIKAGPLGR